MRASSRGNNNYGSGIPVGVVIAITVVTVLAVAICIYKKASLESERKEKLQERIADLRQQVKDHHAETNFSTGLPTDGAYKLSYLDGGSKKTGFATLSFVENGKGFDITGLIKDEDGLSKINEGFASYDGKAYWVDTCTSSSMIVVSDGVFDFDNSTFTGRREADTGERSLYTSFELINKPHCDAHSYFWH